MCTEAAAGVLVFAALTLTTAAGLDCYSCGGLVSTEEGGTCYEFDNALSWSLFRVTCDRDQICVKMTSLYPGEEDRQFRGCGERTASFGLRHELGCRHANVTDSSTEFCFCDTELCNAGARPAAAAAVVGLSAALLALFPAR